METEELEKRIEEFFDRKPEGTCEIKNLSEESCKILKSMWEGKWSIEEIVSIGGYDPKREGILYLSFEKYLLRIRRKK